MYYKAESRYSKFIFEIKILLEKKRYNYKKICCFCMFVTILGKWNRKFIIKIDFLIVSHAFYKTNTRTNLFRFFFFWIHIWILYVFLNVFLFFVFGHWPTKWGNARKKSTHTFLYKSRKNINKYWKKVKINGNFFLKLNK